MFFIFPEKISDFFCEKFTFVQFVGRGGGDISDTQLFSVMSENIYSTLPSNFRTEMTNSVRSKTFYICQAV